MIEVEIKVPVDDIEKVKDVIKRKGILMSISKQRDVYFQHPLRDFSLTDEALRIRDENGECQLTYKGPKISEKSKARIEISVNVSSFNEMKSMLEHLGFRPFMSISKFRETYRIEDALFSIDFVEELGYYVEIEKEIERTEDLNKTENELINLARSFGLDVSRATRKSYLELIIEKKEKNQR